jgi:hypothetical protein
MWQMLRTKCERRDSNPHAVRRQILSLTQPLSPGSPDSRSSRTLATRRHKTPSVAAGSTTDRTTNPVAVS